MVFDAKLCGVHEHAEIAVVSIVVAFERDGVFGFRLRENWHGLWRAKCLGLGKFGKAVTTIAANHERDLSVPELPSETLIAVCVTGKYSVRPYS